MTKKSKDKDKGKEKYYSDYPIKSLFQVSMLAASISFVLFYSNNSSVIDDLFKSFLVFISFSIAGGIIIVVVFSILGNIKQQEYEELVEKRNQENTELEDSLSQQLLPTQAKDTIRNKETI